MIILDFLSAAEIMETAEDGDCVGDPGPDMVLLMDYQQTCKN